MIDTAKQGGAQALPSARAFVGIGGRLLINPDGKLEARTSLGPAFALDAPAHVARPHFTIARRFYRRLHDPRFARSVAALVAVEGERTHNGWLVMVM